MEGATIGKIQRVLLREVWKHEALGFRSGFRRISMWLMKP